MPARLALATMAWLAGCAAARAAGCDLDAVMGYQVARAWTIEGYIDGNGKEQMGFQGCEQGRVLVFTDHSGVRCTGTFTAAARLEVPKAWLFARSRDDMKLCVGGDLYDVAPMR